MSKEFKRPSLRENYFARWGATLTTSGVAYIGAQMLDKSGSSDVNTLADTVEWAAQAGAGVSTLALALGGIHIYAARNRQRQLEALRSSLPNFNTDDGDHDERAVALVQGMELNHRVKDRIAPISDIHTIAFMNNRGYSTEERVKMVADSMIDSIVIVRNQPPGKCRVMADFWFDAADMGYVLDQVYPIDASDQMTPVTVPGERHWFDFAENQAIAQAK